MYKKSVLDNGVRIVTESLDNVKSVALGICILTGSRDEKPEQNGISHFIEHMMFKGTERRTVRDIAMEIERIGAEANAFTAKEFTYYYAHFLDEHLLKIWDLLQDLLQNSTFDEESLKKEKCVVLEELKDFEDSPYDQALHNLSILLYDSHPMSFPILGTKENIRNFKRDDIREFQRSHYLGNNIVVAASGKLEHNKLKELIENSLHFSKGENNKRVPPHSVKKGILLKRKKEIKQVQIAMGRRIDLKYNCKERPALLLLHTLLGGGMSSRLFDRLREREGLVYDITSFLDLFSDGGAIGVYLATSPKNVEKAISIIFEEFNTLRKDGLKKSELKDTKENLKGSLALALDSTTERMIGLLKDEIYLERYVPIEEKTKEIEKVKEDTILSLVERFLDPNDFSISLVGPLKKFEL